MIFKNTKTQGDWGLGCAIGYFTENEYTVSIPLTDSQDYDLVVDKCGLKRVQIKSTTYKAKSGYYVVSFTVKGGNQTFNTIKKLDKNNIDFIFIVTGDKIRYLIPISLIITSSITLNTSWDNYKV